jgi:2'-5' RNA ligase
MKRLFAAIKVHPTEEFLRRYWALKKLLKDEKIKWVDPENIHLTLKFFGETPEHHIPAINTALRQSTRGVSTFNLEITHTGIFGSSYKPRVIWFDISASDALDRLIGNVVKELHEIGIENDRQNFVPHLTVGRIKELHDKKHFQSTIDRYREGYIQKEEVSKFHLFESFLRPLGPKYEVIETYSLNRE